MKPMSCEKIALELMALSDGELSGVAAWRVRQHVKRCSVCAAMLAEYKQLDSTLADLSPLFKRLPLKKPLRVAWTFGSVALATTAIAIGAVSFFQRPALISSASVPASPEPQRLVATYEDSNSKPQTDPKPSKIPPQIKTALNRASVLVEPSPHRRRRLPRRVRRRVLVSKSKPLVRQLIALPVPEEISLVASEVTIARPITTVSRETDADGGTMVIQSTIPAAYVQAGQNSETK
jgi:hypothetical protein